MNDDQRSCNESKKYCCVWVRDGKLSVKIGTPFRKSAMLQSTAESGEYTAAFSIAPKIAKTAIVADGLIDAVTAVENAPA